MRQVGLGFDDFSDGGREGLPLVAELLELRESFCGDGEVLPRASGVRLVGVRDDQASLAESVQQGVERADAADQAKCDQAFRDSPPVRGALLQQSEHAVLDDALAELCANRSSHAMHYILQCIVSRGGGLASTAGPASTPPGCYRLGYARRVHAAENDEVIISRTPDAPWLPAGGSAEVVRLATPPRPMCIVRLLLRQGDTVFCVPRPETGLLDLPMRRVGAEDPTGLATIAALAEEVTGSVGRLMFGGAVRNIVESSTDGYLWPTPHAYFGVWTSASDPIVDGTWIALGAGSELRDRHWYALAD